MDEHESLISSLRDRLQDSEFYRWAGVEVTDASPGMVEIAFEAGPQHLNLQGLVHGGILATLADTAMGLAVRTVLEAGRRHVTVQLGVEFLSAGRPGRIIARGRSIKIGAQLGFAEADVMNGDGRLLARAHSTLSVTKEQPRQ
jgi:uncharacterized protein (TIGR00369 family)